MLKVGEDRATKGLKNPDSIQRRTRSWTLWKRTQRSYRLKTSINQYTIAFGLRNVTNIDIAERSTSSLEERRKDLILEFSHVEDEPLKSLYNFYSLLRFRQWDRLSRTIENRISI